MNFSRLRSFFRRQLQTLSSQDAYAQWAATYPAAAHNRLMQIEQEAMRSLWHECKGKVVLDLACGTGRYALLAQNDAPRHIIAMDNHFSMLQAAETKPLVQATLDTIPLVAGSVDVVLCGLAIGHTPHLDAALLEISRVMCPGGILLLSDFHPLQYLRGAQRTFTAPDGNTYAVEHYPHLDADYLRAAQNAGLTLTAVREPTLPEGDGTPIVLVMRLEKSG